MAAAFGPGPAGDGLGLHSNSGRRRRRRRTVRLRDHRRSQGRPDGGRFRARVRHRRGTAHRSVFGHPDRFGCRADYRAVGRSDPPGRDAFHRSAGRCAGRRSDRRHCSGGPQRIPPRRPRVPDDVRSARIGSAARAGSRRTDFLPYGHAAHRPDRGIVRSDRRQASFPPARVVDPWIRGDVGLCDPPGGARVREGRCPDQQRPRQPPS